MTWIGRLLGRAEFNDEYNDVLTLTEAEITPTQADMRIMGINIDGMRAALVGGLEVSNKRRDDLTEEIERLRGELMNTERAVQAGNAALNVLDNASLPKATFAQPAEHHNIKHGDE